jgi:hypothetical protein
LNLKKLEGRQASKILYVITFLYSVLVFASSLPVFSDRFAPLIILYYLFLPGYFILRLFNEDYPILNRVLYSIILGMTFVAAILSISQLPGLSVILPLNIVVPTVTLFLVVIDYLRGRQPDIGTY